jgi:GAF domain-containing protein
MLQIVMDRMAEFFRPSTWYLLMVDDPKDELYFAIAADDAAERSFTEHEIIFLHALCDYAAIAYRRAN